MNTIRTVSAFIGLAILTATPLNAALITGSVAPAPASVNLTTEGTSDWIHWGRSDVNDVDRKITGLSQISNFTTIGSGTNVVRLTDSPSKSSWTDGMPTLTATNNPGGVYINNFDGPGRGFTFSVPADLIGRVLKVYVGEFTASGTLEATLSDNSAPAYSQALTGAVGQTVQGVYTINYAAASPGQSLTLKWTETADLGANDNITMQAAALSAPVVPEPTTLAIAFAGVTFLFIRPKK
jgi:hypothetical protein